MSNDHFRIRPHISVIVCTYKRPRYLEKCLRSLLANVYEHKEIFVIGQGDDTSTKALIDQQFNHNAGIKYIHTDTIGLSNARNIGCRHAQGEIIAFIDDDATASTDWLAGYAEVFHAIKPDLGVVGGRIKPVWEIRMPHWYPVERQFFLGIYDIGDSIQPFPDADLPVGANFAVRKSILEEIGGFDIRLGFDRSRKQPMIAGEDSLFAHQVKAAGYAIYYQPKATVFHHISARKLSRSYFLRRHYWEGMTRVVLNDCTHASRVSLIIRYLTWHALRMTYVLMRLPMHLLCVRKNQASKIMLDLGDLAYSLGICGKTVDLLFSQNGSKELNHF